MIKAEDLRMGNSIVTIKDKVELNFYGPWTVRGIHEGGITIVSGHFLAYSQIEGIPLTTEFLIKFGFDGEGDGTDLWAYEFPIPAGWNRTPYSMSLNDDGEWDIYWSKEGPITEIKYVHQLQNLYFTLTGEELTLKQ